MKFFIFFLSTIFLFSCAYKQKDSSKAPINVYFVSSEKLNSINQNNYSKESIYLPCEKDSEDFYPVYQTCWNYGYEHKNCKKVYDKSKLNEIIKKSLNSHSKKDALIASAKVFSCGLICADAVKENSPSLNYENYVKDCPVKMKAVLDKERIYIYLVSSDF